MILKGVCVCLLRKGKGIKMSEAGFLRTPTFETPPSALAVLWWAFSISVTSLSHWWWPFSGAALVASLMGRSLPHPSLQSMRSHSLNCISQLPSHDPKGENENSISGCFYIPSHSLLRLWGGKSRMPSTLAIRWWEQLPSLPVAMKMVPQNRENLAEGRFASVCLEPALLLPEICDQETSIKLLYSMMSGCWIMVILFMGLGIIFLCFS